MSNLQIFVILSGIVMTILIAWYFWFALKAQTRVAVSESGAQEVAITVKGGYTPDVIVVRKRRPVRLTFTRQESSACSEKSCSLISIKMHYCPKASKRLWNSHP